MYTIIVVDAVLKQILKNTIYRYDPSYMRNANLYFQVVWNQRKQVSKIYDSIEQIDRWKDRLVDEVAALTNDNTVDSIRVWLATDFKIQKINYEY